MRLTTNYYTVHDIRIANFTDMDLSLNHLLSLDPRNGSSAIDEIRRHADLPYGYLFTTDQTGLINKLMSELKKTRSSCFPYALFPIGGEGLDLTDLECAGSDVDVIPLDGSSPQNVRKSIVDYSRKRFVFDRNRLNISASGHLPEKVDVVVVGAGVTGLYAANQLSKTSLSYMVVDQSDVIGGIWSRYANSTSQVNTSEGGYRLIEKAVRSNRDHSTTREILEDISDLARGVSDKIHLKTRVDWIEKTDDTYQLSMRNGKQSASVSSEGVILAINDRVGEARSVEWKNQDIFRGEILSGISDEAKDLEWKGKKVVIVGMGAYAVENARTALEQGARHVTVVCRRHGTVCPKIIDYLNFATPYDESFKHDKKSNMRNMLLWKKLYDQSGATQPECWPAKIKHDGHTISVSDIWFIGHYLNKIKTISGSISGMYETGVTVDHRHRLDADVVLNCVGFYRNASNVKKICDYDQVYSNNYIDRNLMYIADAYIDDDAFNSFFGSSVLEMAKFYLEVYIRFFENDDYFSMLETEGIEKISIEHRKWSHYIAAAAALMNRYPEIYETARRQVSQRSQNFMQAHDLETYIAANKREWLDTHCLLAGRTMKAEDCLPYVFQKLIDKKI
jgi:hypothetical protein